MEISKTATGFFVALCLTAGAGGAYLGLRSGPAATTDPEAVAAAPDPASGAVEQSEGVIDDTAANSSGQPNSSGQQRSALTAAPAPVASAPQARTTAPSPSPATRSSAPAASNRAATPAPRARTETPAPAREPTAAAPAPSREPAREIAVAAPEPARAADVQPSRPVEQPAPQFEDLVLSADSVIGLHVDTAVTSERARVEDEVLASVMRDVRVGDRVVIPAGSKAHGEVTLVERGGKLRDRARLGIRFTSIVLADGTRVPLDTETIYREGDSPTGESAAKIGGGAIGGAILGGIFGGAKGAILGGTAGAGAGTAVVVAGGRNPATLPAGTPVTVRILKPATITVEK
jgi:hypothetical protein